MWDADDFAGDPYGHATNQAGHAFLVGAPMALIFLTLAPPVAVPILAAMLYGIIWEILIQRGRLWADSLMDTACVMVGSSVICGGFTYIPPALFWQAWVTITACFIGYAIVVGWGFLRRWRV